MSVLTRRRRVVMALASGDIDDRGLERLSRLAARLDAELEALFVEDRDLLQLVELPFLREFRFASMRLEGLRTERLEEELRLAARRAEQALAAQQSLRTIPWHFRVWRGSLEQELLGAVEADVIALAGPAPATGPWRAVARAGEMLVVTVYAGGETGRRALDTAAQLAGEGGAELLVLVPAPESPAQVDATHGEIEARLAGLAGPMAPRWRVQALAQTSVAALAAALPAQCVPLLVLPRDSDLLRAASLRELRDALRGELFIVN